MASSLPFHAPDSAIPKGFRLWVRELDALHQASKKKEAEITNEDPSLLIASELVKNGITINSSVEDALEIMAHRQNMSDTIPLAVVMDKLPQQWSLYRIALQHNARDYFREHLTEAPDFMAQYFRSITFVTLWNDVWMRYVETAGGRQLAILHGVQINLLEAEKPGPKAARMEARAAIRKPHEEAFPYNAEELLTVCKQGLTAIETQIVTQGQMMSELDKQLAKTRKRQAWLKTKVTQTDWTMQVTQKLDPSITEDEREQLRSVKINVNKFCETLYNSDHVIDEHDVLQRLVLAMKNERDKFYGEFEAEFKKREWQYAYRAFARASLNQIKARQLREFFDKTTDDKDSMGTGILEIISKSELTEQNGMNLIEKRNEAREKYIKSAKAMSEAAQKHDAGQYNYYVAMECEERFGRSEIVNVKDIKDYLRKNFEPLSTDVEPQPGADMTRMDERITKDSKYPNRDPVKRYCRAFLMVNAHKDTLRDSLDDQIKDSSDPLKDEPSVNLLPDRKTAAAEKICRDVLAKLKEQSSVDLETKEIQRLINSTLAQKQPEMALNPIELFRRSIMPNYMSALRNNLKNTWLAILHDNKLAGLSEMIDKTAYGDQTAVDTVLTNRMKSFAQSEGAATFEQAIEYARWLSWVFHQDNVKNRSHRQ